MFVSVCQCFYALFEFYTSLSLSIAIHSPGEVFFSQSNEFLPLHKHIYDKRLAISKRKRNIFVTSQLFLGDLDESHQFQARSHSRSETNGMQTQRLSDESSPKNKRKSLPTVPSPEEEKSMNLSVARQRSPGPNSSQVKAYGPYFLEYTLMAE